MNVATGRKCRSSPSKRATITHAVGPAKLTARRDQRLEDRLEVDRRAADDTEHARWSLSAVPAHSVARALRACTSSNSRVFSMAITAWSAKVLSELDLPVGKRARPCVARGLTPTARHRAATGRQHRCGGRAGDAWRSGYSRLRIGSIVRTWIVRCSSESAAGDVHAVRSAPSRMRRRSCIDFESPMVRDHVGRRSPSRETRCSISLSQSRAAVSAMASSTGWRSIGERLMTSSTSLVAVWYSRDSSARSCAPAPPRTAARSRWR